MIDEVKKFLQKRISDTNICYGKLVEPYTDKELGVINISCMSRKEKEEFVNQRNCLLVQRSCYGEVLDFIENMEVKQ